MDKYLESRGIDVKVKPISILDEDFQSHVRKRKRTKTKAAEIEHAIRHHLDVELDDDPDLQASFLSAGIKSGPKRGFYLVSNTMRNSLALSMRLQRLLTVNFDGVHALLIII